MDAVLSASAEDASLAFEDRADRGDRGHRGDRIVEACDALLYTGLEGARFEGLPSTSESCATPR